MQIFYSKTIYIANYVNFVINYYYKYSYAAKSYRIFKINKNWELLIAILIVILTK